MAKNKVEKTASASKKPAVSKVPKSKTKVNKKAGLEDKVQSYLYDKNTDVKDISKESEQFIEKPEVLQVTESKGNKKSKKSKKVSTSSIKARIGKFFLKLFFIYIPVFVISLVVLVLIVLKLVLSPGLVEKLAMDNFNKLSNGSLSLDVKEFSPYSGFVIEKIVLKNSKEFDNSDFVVIDKLVFKYGFFSIFTGNIHIDEIGIYKPRIALKQSSGKWNFETLMKPTAKEPEEEIVEEPKKEGEPLKEINLPISVQFLFKFVLSELSVTVDADTFKTELRDFTFLTDIYIPPFKRVPLSLEAAKLLQTCDIRINPAEKLNLYFNSKEAEVTPPLILGLDVLFNNALPNQPRFNSSLRIGTYNTPIRFNQAHLAPLNFLVYYDLFYEPVDDTLKIDSFGISFNGDKLLNIAGTVSSVTTKQEIDIKMTESKINLSSLYPYFKAVTGNNDLKFSGIISLMPLTIKGDPKKLDVNGALNMNSIYVNVPGFVLNMPKFVFDYTVLLRDDNAIVSTELQMPDFHYVLNKEKSGLNSFYLGLKASTAEQFKKFNISDFNIRLMDSVSKINALTMSLNGDVSMIDGTSGKITIPAIVLRLKPLGNTLPKSIRDSLAGIPINKPVTLNLATVFSMTEAAIKAELGLGVVVPDYNVTDLNIGLSMM